MRDGGEVRAIHEKLIEIATQGDAAWFAAHPDRRLRLRDAVRFEFNEDMGPPPSGMTARTLVVQMQPGARLRQPVAVPAGLDNDEADDDDLARLFEQVAPEQAKQIARVVRDARSKRKGS